MSRWLMVKKAAPAPRREHSLSRDRIVDVAIELLDAEGESGLTFRALAGRLATGPGAIYWHVANKGELLTAVKLHAPVQVTLMRPGLPEAETFWFALRLKL